MKHLHLFIFFLFICGSLSAQDTTAVKSENLPEGRRLHIGLVLSGGGAKGLAHIGVLKEIERAGIKIDYIGGTSMGAIVGALYASGYTAHQLDSIFTKVNFEQLIQDELPRKSRSFQEKEDAERYAITLPFEDFNITFPSALSKGQNVFNLLSRLTNHVKDVNDFTELPIPFFCVATDAEKGEAIILDSGYLPQAITASGALPSLFSPVTIDDKLLIDGGVINNYPVEELLSRGVDFVIGVDVQDELRSKEQLLSAPEILIQINNYRTIQAMPKKIEKTDIYIKPDITGFTVVDFGKGKQIITAGAEKAKEYRFQFEAIADLQKEKYMKPPLQKEEIDSIYLKSISIKGNSYYTRSYILGKLKMKPPLTTTNDHLVEGVNNLAATGNFERISHKLEEYEDNSYHLELNLKETEITTFIRASVHYDDLYKSAALGNITKKRILFKNDVASLDLILGDNLRTEFNYYSDSGFYIGFGLRSYYNSFERRVNTEFLEQISEINLENFRSLNLNYDDFTTQIYMQTLFKKQFSLDLGAEYKYLSIEGPSIRDQTKENRTFYFDRSSYVSAYGKLRLDTFDNRYFPSRGWYFDGDFHLYLFSSDYTNRFTSFSIGSAVFKHAMTIAPKISVVAGVEGGFKISGKGIKSLDFFLGGWGNNFKNNIVPFLGYDFLSVSGDGLVKSDFSVDYNFYKKHHLNAGFNIANLENGLFSSGNWLSSPDYTGYFLGYGLETFAGPLQAKFTYSPELDQSFWFFSLGFWF